MKVLFTSFSYLPERSGIPVVVQYLAEGLSVLGHDVSVYTCLNGKDLPRNEIINGVKVRRFNFGLSLTKKIYGEVDEYINSVMHSGTDVLILECLQCHTTDVLLPIIHRLSCKTVLHAHGAPGLLMKPLAWEGDFLHSVGHIHNWYRWRRYYKDTFPKYSNSISASISSCLCSSDIDYLTKYTKQAFVLENSTDDLFFDSSSYTADISSVIRINSSSYIINIANFSDRKNQLYLIDSFENANIKDVALVLLGTSRNEYYEKLKARAQLARDRSNCEILILDETVDRSLFPSLLYNSKLFVLSSKWEEYSIALVEAMAVGTPFLSTLAGNARLLPGGVTARTKDEFSFMLKSMLSNPDYLSRYGHQGKEYASHFCKRDYIVRQLEAYLMSL